MNQGPEFKKMRNTPKNSFTPIIIKSSKIKREMDIATIRGLQQLPFKSDDSILKEKIIEDRVFSIADSDRLVTNDFISTNKKLTHKSKLNFSVESTHKQKSIIGEETKYAMRILKDRLLLEMDFREKTYYNNKKPMAKKSLLRKIDIDSTLGGRFRNKFTANLKKSTKKDENDEFFLLSEGQQSQNQIEEEDLFEEYEITNLPIIKNKEIFLKNNFVPSKGSMGYNHALFMKQKFVNHKKLFKSMEEFKRVCNKANEYNPNKEMSNYSKIKNNVNNLNNMTLYGHSKERLLEKDRIMKEVVKNMNFRRTYCNKLGGFGY